MYAAIFFKPQKKYTFMFPRKYLMKKISWER